MKAKGENGLEVIDISEKRRILSGKKLLPGARLKPKRLGFGVEKVS
jgi:hypothetical protein